MECAMRYAGRDARSARHADRAAISPLRVESARLPRRSGETSRAVERNSRFARNVLRPPQTFAMVRGISNQFIEHSLTAPPGAALPQGPITTLVMGFLVNHH